LLKAQDYVPEIVFGSALLKEESEECVMGPEGFSWKAENQRVEKLFWFGLVERGIRGVRYGA